MAKTKHKEEKKLTAEEVVGRQAKPVWLIVSTVAMVLIMTGTLMPLFHRGVYFHDMPPAFRYIYASGAALLLLSRLMSPYRGKALRLKRLFRIETWGALFFCVGAFFLFYNPTSARDWLAFTLAGGALQIYTSIMIPRTVRKLIKG